MTCFVAGSSTSVIARPLSSFATSDKDGSLSSCCFCLLSQQCDCCSSLSRRLLLSVLLLLLPACVAQTQISSINRLCRDDTHNDAPHDGCYTHFQCSCRDPHPVLACAACLLCIVCSSASAAAAACWTRCSRARSLFASGSSSLPSSLADNQILHCGHFKAASFMKSTKQGLQTRQAQSLQICTGSASACGVSLQTSQIWAVLAAAIAFCCCGVGRFLFLLICFAGSCALHRCLLCCLAAS